MRWRWRYDGFENFDKALTAIGRRSRGFVKQDKAEALRRGRSLYEAAEAAVERSAGNLPVSSGGNPPNSLSARLDMIAASLAGEHPGFSQVVYRDAVDWAYYWMVLR